MSKIIFRPVVLLKFSSDLCCSKQLIPGDISENSTDLSLDFNNSHIIIRKGEVNVHELAVVSIECCLLNDNCVALRPETCPQAYVFQFSSALDAQRFNNVVKEMKKIACTKSAFDQRTEESSATQYFQFYGYLSQQQNMLQDYIRTFTYQRAVLSNLSDFKDKVVLDVGAGSGILSFFAAQAGARKVYAVEASSMAQFCEALVKHNHLDNRITVVAGKIEDITLPEMVDTIISEPMGYMLLNERMLETFLHAKKFLKPRGGRMFPSRGDLHISPFTDESLYLEQCGKANFWYQESFHGVNLSTLRQQALKEYFKQPVVDTFHVGILLAQSVRWSIDFLEQSEASLHYIEIPLDFVLQQTAFIHGLAFWFDVAFIGTNQTVWLSTAPTEPLTHWYQVRCLLERPLFGQMGARVTGKVVLVANKRQSYDVDLELTCNGQTSGNSLDLKNPCFRYTGQAVQPPPGMQTTSPTEAYWAQLAAAGQVENGQPVTVGAPMMNGMIAPDGSLLPTATANVATMGNVVTFLPTGQPLTTLSPAPGTLLPAVTTAGVPVNRMMVNPQVQQVPIVQQQQTQTQQQMFPPHQAVNLTDYLLAGLGSPPGAASPTQQTSAPLITNPLKM